MLKKLQTYFEWAASKIENNPTPLPRYYFLFFAILAVRLTLEFFSSKRLFSLYDVVHIGLWFIFIVLAFLLQLQLFSKEKVSKIAKLVITCFTIALSAPILDLIISKGVGAKMNYLAINSWQDVVWSYLSIGGASLSRGATLGIRIEIVLLLIASFNYVRTKRQQLGIALLSAFSIYTVLFFSGAIPFLLSLLIHAFQLNYQADDQSTSLLLLTLDLLLLFGLMWRHSPIKMKQIFANIAWRTFFIASLQFLIGALLAHHFYPQNWQLSPSTIFWFPLLVALGFCFAAYQSLGRMKEQNALIFNTLLILISTISCLISSKLWFVLALNWGILYLWKEPPLSLIQVPILRNVMAGGMGVATSLAGFVTFGAPMIGFPATWLFFLLLSGTTFSLCKEWLSPLPTMIPWLDTWKSFGKKVYLGVCSVCLLAVLGSSTLLAPATWLVVLLFFNLFLYALPFILTHNVKKLAQWCVCIFYVLISYFAWKFT